MPADGSRAAPVQSCVTALDEQISGRGLLAAWALLHLQERWARGDGGSTCCGLKLNGRPVKSVYEPYTRRDHRKIGERPQLLAR